MKKQLRKTRHTLTALLAALVLAVSMTACGSNSYSTGSGSANYKESARIDAPCETPSEEEAGAANVDTGGGSFSELASQASVPTNLNLKLIWRADIRMETLQFDQSISSITEKVSQLGGFVENSYTSGGSDLQGNYMEKYATLTLRVPADKLNDFLSDLGDYGTITRQNLSSENISLEYADTEARKRALETEYDRLLELMAKAESIDTVIALEARMSEVRLQLDALSSQLRSYDNLVDYSTVEIDIQEVRKISPTNAVTVTERIKNGFSNSLYSVGVFLEDLMIFLIVNIPIFVVIALFAALVLFIVKRVRRRKKPEQAEKKERRKKPVKPTADSDRTDPPAPSEPQDK